MYKYSISFPNEMKVMSPTISIWNVCIRVWGHIQPIFTGKHSQMVPALVMLLSRVLNRDEVPAKERDCLTPSSSAAHQQCRSWAVTHTTLLPHYPLGFFSIHLACQPQFFSDSSQITYITPSQPLQLPPNEFITTVKSLIAFNNVSYVQILFTDPTDA